MRAFVLALSLFFGCSPLIHATTSVQSFTLDNGLKILVKEDHRAPVVVSMLWYNVGSSDEVSGMTGLSHALEHMMFKGTPKNPLGVFSKILAASGSEDNAFTNYDYTAYYEKLPADKLSLAFSLEADRMQNLIFDEKEFSKEISVIREERRQRTDDSPQGLALERFLATAHLSMPYQHPVIGWMDDLHHMKLSELKAWYEKYYAPNNATLVVVGDVQPQQVLSLAKQYFGAIPARPAPSRKTPVEPPALGKKSVKIHAPAQLPVIMMGFTVPGITTASKPWEPYALEVLAGVLDAGDSARFTRELIRADHIASSMGAWYNLYSRYQSQFILYGSPAASHTIADIENALIQQIKRLQKTSVPEAELQRVKNQIIAQKTYEKDSIFSQAMELGLLETVGLGWQKAAIYAEQINQVTPEQIQEVANRYFQENAMTTAELIPLSQGKP